HHLSADDLETLEKAAVEAFKLGYEVTDPEELEVEDGDIVICCDILSECALNADLIDAQVEQLMTLAEKFDVEYDGWGTYFEDPNGEDGDDEDFVDEDDDGVRH
ncbi:ribonuclease E inhibitor RraB, partial [Escherichia coli]|nr:ribonuclease E inhibitor RraB [Escherichia coli]NAJ37253.1 ribonuclease E inhibitor RraB [Escherichia coli]